MFNVNIEGKNMSWYHHVNKLRTRLTSLPFMMNSSDSEHAHDPSAHITSSTTQTFCRLTRVRQPYQARQLRVGVDFKRREGDVIFCLS